MTGRTYVALVIIRVQVLPIPARREEGLGAHLLARLLIELGCIAPGIKADVRYGTMFGVGVVVGPA